MQATKFNFDSVSVVTVFLQNGQVIVTGEDLKSSEMWTGFSLTRFSFSILLNSSVNLLFSFSLAKTYLNELVLKSMEEEI